MFDHHGVGAAETAVQQICGPDDTSGCNQVSQSRYSTLVGFSLGGVGLVYYSSLAFLGALALVTKESSAERGGSPRVRDRGRRVGR